MSMLDVARFLSYSRSVDVSSRGEHLFSLSMVDRGHLFSCLHGDASHWSFGRKDTRSGARSAREETGLSAYTGYAE